MRSYQNMVFTTAYRLLADEAEAQDIAQEVFLKAYEHFEKLQHSACSAGGWLKTVTRNLCLNHLSRYRSRWRLFTEIFSRNTGKNDSDELDTLLAPDNFSHPRLETEEHRSLLSKALNDLPRSQRIPLVLYHIEEMSYEEISRDLGISLSKVKVDIHRGRLALRHILNQFPECRTV